MTTHAKPPLPEHNISVDAGFIQRPDDISDGLWLEFSPEDDRAILIRARGTAEGDFSDQYVMGSLDHDTLKALRRAIDLALLCQTNNNGDVYVSDVWAYDLSSYYSPPRTPFNG